MSRARPFRLRRFPPIQIAAYLILRSVLMVVHMFPFEMAPQVGRWIGRIWKALDKRHRGVAARNVAASPGICAPEEIPAFIDRVYEHVGRSLVEVLMTPRLLQRGMVQNYVTVHRNELVDQVLKDGRGAIIAMGHLGNWELTGIAVALHGYKLTSLMRPIENPWIDAYLTRFRTVTGHGLISKYDAWGPMVATVQRNELLVIQIDQDARHRGVFVEFFGRPASTQKSPAVLSLKYGCPIVSVNIYRDGLKHRCEVAEIFFPDDFKNLPDPVQAMTQAYTRKLEEFVRQHPEQWNWLHARWKTVPTPESKPTEALA